MTPSTAQSAPSGEPQGLGGWLIAWAAWVGLAVAALGYAGTKIGLLAVGLEKPLSIDWPGDPPMGRDEIMKHGVWAVSLLTAAVLGISVLWLHIRRSKHARLAHCLWLLGVAGFPLFEILRRGLTSMMTPLAAIFLGSIASAVYLYQPAETLTLPAAARTRRADFSPAISPPPDRSIFPPVAITALPSHAQHLRVLIAAMRSCYGTASISIGSGGYRT